MIRRLMNKLRPLIPGVSWGPERSKVTDQEWADDLTMFTESLPEMELVGQQCFAFVSVLALSMNDKTSVKVFGPVTGNLGQQLRRRRGDAAGPPRDQCSIGPFVCKNLRADFPLLGVWLTQNLYGACHFRFRYKKCLKAIGKINRMWCNHPGMSFKEEWQLWNVFWVVHSHIRQRNLAFSIVYLGRKG